MFLEAMTEYLDERGILHCPSCGGSSLHQRKTDVYEAGEESHFNLHISVSRKGLWADRDLSGNPSPKRQGLTVEFDCEDCEEIHQLRIYQHQGGTYCEFSVKRKYGGKEL